MELLDKENQDLMVMATFVVCGALQRYLLGARSAVSNAGPTQCILPPQVPLLERWAPVLGPTPPSTHP